MEFYVAHRSPASGADPLLALFLFEGKGPLPREVLAVDRAAGGLVARVRESGEFAGRASDALLLHSGAAAGPRRILLVGLGTPSAFTTEVFRRAAGVAGLAARRAMTGEMAALLPERGLGGFRLDPRQAAPWNAVVERPRLARALDAPERANLLAAVGGTEPVAALERAVTLADFGLSVIVQGDEVLVESDRLIFDDALAARIVEHAARSGAAATKVLTHLAKRMRVGSREVPYSTVTATDSPAGLVALDGAPLAPLARGEIALNAWAAGQLDARPGATLELTYFTVGPRGVIRIPRERT